MTFPVRLEWWANRSMCLGAFDARIEVVERPEGLSAGGALTAAECGDPLAIEAWNLFRAVEPVFKLVFEDGSDFEVEVEPGPGAGGFRATEYLGSRTRRVELSIDLTA
ncbi:hypothetical protein [Glycomyces paridis]|uniref:hypothetical protein n=1 Tax=Glycomyces paridis TaxID=2126555 RepID=UPI0013052E47|nr:hypothetical protein [Glycomyces paridis]